MKNQKILCACGCGESLDKFDPQGRPRKSIGSHLENMHDAIRKGRVRGTAITNEQLAEIMQMKRSGISQLDIARKFGINQSTVSRFSREER